jgi:metal-responsive CopG/Arc/MetJ family transcriptional regulator
MEVDMNQVRVQILLEPRQHTALKKAARRANKSMSELVREITDEYLSKNEPDQEDEMLMALDNLKRIREKQVLYQGNPVVEAREERQRQLDGDL